MSDNNTSNEDLLETRGRRYGEFKDQALMAQQLKQSLRVHANNTEAYKSMTPFMWEALDMICHKLARVVNGDPMYIDSWRDVSAYAELVAKELQGTYGATDALVTTVVNTQGVWEPIK